ncbi:unnamed protein product [Mytilus coruscus]|uniref:Uncharacterized protein n=1 Tax=Mytilus coruscus TaxID=42192 RepID=A0A6J8AF10_MYTCO|nr:unnamed protein product [Mytilus coruscus]
MYIPDAYRSRVLQMLNCNRDIFAVKDTELGQTYTVKMRIDTGDHPPVKLKPYRTPLHKREIADKAIIDMLEANIIRRSNSSYSSPVTETNYLGVKINIDGVKLDDAKVEAIETLPTPVTVKEGNAKVERFHKTLHDLMTKKLLSHASTLDVCLNQTIGAIRKSKLDSKWKPYFRIIEKTSAVTFVLENQLDGSVARKVHLEHLKNAKINEWVIQKNIEGRQLRKTNYVVPPEDSDGSESELPDADPRERLINRYRQERETSSDEDNIPLAELKQKFN